MKCLKRILGSSRVSMTFDAMIYTRRITKSSRLKYWTVVIACKCLQDTLLSNTCEKGEYVLLVHKCNKPCLVTAPHYNVCINIGTKLRLWVTYGCHSEGQVPRKLLIRSNGNLRYLHTAKGWLWRPCYVLTHLPATADLYFQETKVTGESHTTHSKKGSWVRGRRKKISTRDVHASTL